jgi:hypothetical protein
MPDAILPRLAARRSAPEVLFARCLALVLLAVAAAASASAQVRDIDGRAHELFAPAAAAQVLLFVSSDCPLSNGYSPELQRVCGEYGGRGASCLLVYEDLQIDAAAVRAHLREYGYGNIAALVDRDRAIATRAGATVTPQAVVVGADGRIRYRGRIDNKHEELGRPRRVVTSHDLRDALDAVLSGQPVARPDTPALGCHIVAPDVLRKNP